MRSQSTITQVRLKNIIAGLTPAITLLNEANDAFGTPFVQAISNTTVSLITAVQNVKKKKDECVQLLENIHQLLYAIVNLHIKSGGVIPPANLYDIARFTETLHKIHVFVESQQDTNRIKHFFRQSEINTLLNDCRVGVQQALDVFKIESGMMIFNSMVEMRDQAENMHKEMLELISTFSDGTISDRASSIYTKANGSQNSSNTFFVLLPARPQIFHGRDPELKHIVEILSQDVARIAILGGGGMGKTSLARTALHHPSITTRYEHCFFVICDSATTSIEIAALIGAHIGLNPGKDLTNAVIQYFNRGPLSLLVLDNLETPWEPKESRAGVEEFLSLLTDIPHLALLITMRGAERPARVRWTHPFLPPLKPLSDDAAQQTFFDIAEDFHAREDVNKLLRLTDNMPLAVDLIAHLVDYEGCANVLTRWETEKTSILSCGYDRGSSLDVSINISLSSPRVSEVQGAKDLLSLLSILPDGLSDVELVQSNLPIEDVRLCKLILLGTALAYSDEKKRLKSLVPIREHIQHFYPPSPHLIHPLRKHLRLLVDLYEKNYGAHQMAGQMNQLTSNLGNLQQVLMLELNSSNPDLVETVGCALALNAFSRVTGHGPLTLLDSIPALFPEPCDHRLETQYIIELLNSGVYHTIMNPALLISQGILHLDHLKDHVVEWRLYIAIAHYYLYHENGTTEAMEFFEKALHLSRSIQDRNQQSITLFHIAEIKWKIGDYLTARRYACEGQRLARLSGNLYDEARAVRTEALCCNDLGDYKNSSSLTCRAKKLLSLCGMSGGTLEQSIMNTQAELHLMKSEYVEARNIHTHILQNTSEEQDEYNYAFVLLNIAQIDVIIGADEHDVEKNLEEAKIIFSNNSFSGGITDCEMILANLNLREGNIIVAQTLFQKCLNSSWGTQNQTVTCCLESLADVSRWGNNDFVWQWAVVYLGQAQKVKQKLELHKALQFLGDVFLAHGDDESANNLFNTALEGFTAMDVHRSRAQCMLRLGDIAKRQGDLVTAIKLWTEARPLFERCLQAKDLAQIDIQLAAVTST
ncbi:hypothetical protein C8R44DRAFT_848591 [Mycena epipterygia]|nr:hypothetical protein C8R44DRAFT_848591 [Mycena epipterygia]